MLGDLFQCDPDLRFAGSEIYLDPQEPRKISGEEESGRSFSGENSR
jgi:hypothetical protein